MTKEKSTTSTSDRKKIMRCNTKFLIVVFDALRPEFVTPELMPNLYRFQANGVRYVNSRSIFPTETRVNQTAVVTGCKPGRNGIVANFFLAKDVWSDRIINTGDELQLAEAFKSCDTRLINTLTLSERLSRAGLTYASLSAGTAGGGRLINHSAEQDGTFRLAMRAPEVSQPAGVLEKVIATCGHLPEYRRPAIDWISWAVNGYLDYVLPHHEPHVMLLWLCEPDETFHYHGIGSSESLQTIRHLDAEFGRILLRLRSQIVAGDLQVIALSDHGQISLAGEPVDIVAGLQAAGFKAASQADSDLDCIVHIHNSGGIWVKDHSLDLIESLVDYFLHQSWCGPVFTRSGVAGTLSLAAVGLDHPRAPDISITCRASAACNRYGTVGSTVHDAPYPVGGGCHGGLSQYELLNFMSFIGSAFKEFTTITLPASNIDITPTILSTLGVEYSSDEFDGRLLSEALVGAGSTGQLREFEQHASNTSGPCTCVSYSEYQGVRYLNRSWLT